MSGKKHVALSSSRGARKLPRVEEDKQKIKQEPTDPHSKPPPHPVSSESLVPDDDDNTSCNLPPPFVATRKIKEEQSDPDPAQSQYPLSSKSTGPRPRPIFDLSRDSTPRKAWYWLLAPDGTPATVDSSRDVVTTKEVEVAAAAKCGSKQEVVSPPSTYAAVPVSAKRPRIDPGHFHAKDAADDTSMDVDDKILAPGGHLPLEATIHGDRFTVDAWRSTQRKRTRRIRELDVVPIKSGSDDVDQEFSNNESKEVIDLSSEHEENDEEGQELASKVSIEVFDLSNEDEENDEEGQELASKVSAEVIDLLNEDEENEEEGQELASKVSAEDIDLSNEDEENDNGSQQVSDKARQAKNSLQLSTGQQAENSQLRGFNLQLSKDLKDALQEQEKLQWEITQLRNEKFFEHQELAMKHQEEIKEIKDALQEHETQKMKLQAEHAQLWNEKQLENQELAMKHQEEIKEIKDALKQHKTQKMQLQSENTKLRNEKQLENQALVVKHIQELEELKEKLQSEISRFQDEMKRKQIETDSVNESLSALPSRKETRTLLLMCRENQWDQVLESIRSNHLIATASFPNGPNGNSHTTVLHQAITSKGDTKKRMRVIQEILHINPLAASITNSHAFLPLHAISQPNTKMDCASREILIRNLIHAYPESLIHGGGDFIRTPLHIILAANLSAEVTSTMIQYGRQACFIRDYNGFLPVHVACSRRCTLENLRMLLEANPASLFAKTKDGRTLLDLAKGTATKSYPNFRLIREIERRMEIASSSTTT